MEFPCKKKLQKLKIPWSKDSYFTPNVFFLSFFVVLVIFFSFFLCGVSDGTQGLAHLGKHSTTELNT
jgi:hypothetical protein